MRCRRRTVAQSAKGKGIAALQGAWVRGDGGQHLTATKPILTDILIVNHQVEQKAACRGEGGDDPGGQAVSVDGNAQGGGAGAEAGQVRREGAFHQRDLVMMADQPQTGVRGGAGLATANEKGARRLFQRLDPLGDGRGGNVKLGRGKIERPTTVDGGKSGKLGGVKH